MQMFQSRYKRAVEFILSRRKFGTTFGLLENFPISSNIFFRFANVRFFSLSHVLRDDKKIRKDFCLCVFSLEMREIRS